MLLRSLVLCALLLPLALRAEPGADEPMMLVAQPDVRGALFESSIVFVRPMPDGSHLGFILNRRTSATMVDLFPGDAASQKVSDPIYLGGPDGYNRMFALVDKPGEGAMQLMPGLFLVAEAKDIDSVIAHDHEHARFFLGLVTWEPGQLEDELSRGFWYIDRADAKLVLDKKTDGLWEELVRRSEARAHAI